MSYIIPPPVPDFIWPPLFPQMWIGAPQDIDGENVATAQAWGGFLWGGGGVVLATRRYLFGGTLRLTTHTNAHSIGVSFGIAGGALHSIHWEGVGCKVAENGTATTVWRGVFNDLTNRQLTPSDTTAGAWIEVNGVIRVSDGGVFSPYFTMSATGAAPVNRQGTRFWVHEKGAAEDDWTGNG